MTVLEKLTGEQITKDGKPLREYFREIIKEDARSEFHSVVGHRTSLIRHGVKSRFPVLTGVAKRVRRLTDDEIRKEYGIMEKPVGGVVENICWLLTQKDKVTSSDVAKELGIPTPDVASRFVKIYKRLEPKGILTRKREGLGYTYRLTPTGKQLTAKELYEEYTIKLQTLKPKPQNVEATPVTEDKIVATHTPEELIESIRRLKLVVELRGTIKILFGFVRE